MSVVFNKDFFGKEIMGNYFNEDLIIRSFVLYEPFHVSVYVCTDKVLFGFGSEGRQWCYETMVCLSSDIKSDFLMVQERCFSELEAFRQHKLVYKKLKKGIYDNEIEKILEREGFIND